MIKFKIKIPSGYYITLDGHFRDSGHVVTHPEAIVYPIRPNSFKVIQWDYNDVFYGIPVSWSLTQDKTEIIGLINKTSNFNAKVMNRLSIDDQVYQIVEDWKRRQGRELCV